MCIAIMKPKDKVLSKEILETCCKANPDGMGFAYIDGDTMYIKKYMKFEDFYKDYKEVENKSNMLIHFRIATHGKVEIDNCHPFWLNHRMALVHNGVISGYGDRDTKSDTRDFIDKVIGNISWKLMKNPSYRELVGKCIGYSKFAILDISGDYWIINEDKGVWDDGVWYSNTSYKPKKSVSYTTYPSSTTSDTNSKVWDMYGDEDYDAWWERVYGNNNKDVKKKNDNSSYNFDDDNLIYKCQKCGAEFIENYEVDDPMCNVCKSTDVVDVGITYRNEKYYYEDLAKE